MTALDSEARPLPPVADEPRAEQPLTGLCPYLAAVDGRWRSATVAREHRCGAVAPPAPLAAEKQRRLCLTAEHPTCATFEAARAARPIAHDRSPMLPRPLARMTPIVLDRGRLAVRLPTFRSDRSTVQVLLVGLLAIAFTAIVLARIAGGAPGGAVDGSPTPSASARASTGPTPAAPTSRPTSAVGPSATPGATQGSGGSASPITPSPSTSATRTYKVKAGDTLIGIAAKFGTTAKALASLNGITDLSSLRIGQILKIP